MSDEKQGGRPVYWSRRGFLFSTGAIGCGFLAGCAETDDGESESIPADDDTDQSTQSNDADNGGSVEGGSGDNGNESGDSGGSDPSEPSVNVVQAEVFTVERDEEVIGDDLTWSTLKLENPTSIVHRDVRVELRYRDGEGGILDTREFYTALLPSETTVHLYSQHNFDESEVAEVDHLIVDQNLGIRGEFVEEYTILDKTMSQEGNIVRVTGELDIQESVDDITIVPLVYDDEGQFIGAFRIRGANVGGETTAFSGGLAMFNIPETRPQPAETRLVIAHPYL